MAAAREGERDGGEGVGDQARDGLNVNEGNRKTEFPEKETFRRSLRWVCSFAEMCDTWSPLPVLPAPVILTSEQRFQTSKQGHSLKISRRIVGSTAQEKVIRRRTFLVVESLARA